MEPSRNYMDPSTHNYRQMNDTVLKKAQTAAQDPHTRGRIKNLSSEERQIVYAIATKGTQPGLWTEKNYVKICEKLDGSRVSKKKSSGVIDKTAKSYHNTVGMRLSSHDLIRVLLEK